MYTIIALQLTSFNNTNWYRHLVCLLLFTSFLSFSKPTYADPTIDLAQAIESCDPNQIKNILKQVKVRNLIDLSRKLISPSTMTAPYKHKMRPDWDASLRNSPIERFAHRLTDLFRTNLGNLTYTGLDLPAHNEPKPVNLVIGTTLCLGDVVTEIIGLIRPYTNGKLDDYCDEEDRTPAYWAMKLPNIDALREFAQFYPDVNLITKQGDSAWKILVSGDYWMTPETIEGDPRLQIFTEAKKNDLFFELVQMGYRHGEDTDGGSRAGIFTAGAATSNVINSTILNPDALTKSKLTLLELDWPTDHSPGPGYTLDIFVKGVAYGTFAIAGFRETQEVDRSVKRHSIQVLTKTSHPLRAGTPVVINPRYDNSFDTANRGKSDPIIVIAQGTGAGPASLLINSLLDNDLIDAKRIRLIQASRLTEIPDWDDNYKNWTERGVSIVIASGSKTAQNEQSLAHLPSAVKIMRGRIHQVIQDLARDNPEFFSRSPSVTPYVFGVGSVGGWNSFISEAYAGLTRALKSKKLKPVPIHLNIIPRGYDVPKFPKESYPLWEILMGPTGT